MTAHHPVKLLVASCPAERLASIIAAFEPLLPGAPLIVLSEFTPPSGEWIPYHVLRSVDENIEYCRAKLAGRPVGLCGISAEPGRQFHRLRWIGCRLAPTRLCVIDERLKVFALSIAGLPAVVRFVARRAVAFGRRQMRTGGWLNTWLGRFARPGTLRRPLYYRMAQIGGRMAAYRRGRSPVSALTVSPAPLSDGVSVVIPSRNGRGLLEECLPPLLAQLGEGEVIVVDNGSDDGTAEFLGQFERVAVEHSAAPLSFARAVNRGIGRARFSHVCLLNNDMVVERGFLEELRAAFHDVPELFCATAQIFMPEGRRREETGKAVMPLKRPATEFPVTCVDPVDGENHTYVLYGSGGASLYDARKLRTLGGFAEVFDPAYVEDLDIGFNAWRAGWPTVFVSGARVLHQHRATTARYYSESQLHAVLERNYLRFLARSVTDPALFAALWREALWRITVDGIQRAENTDVLRQAIGASSWIEPAPAAVVPEPEVLALGSGAVAVFPGRRPTGAPRVVVVSPYVPFPLSHGGAVRMYNLLRRAAKDFDQVLVCFVDELVPAPAELLTLFVEVVYVKRFHTHALPSSERPDMVEEFDSPVMRAALRQTVRKWTPAVAQLEFTHMAQYDEACRPARTILVEHDITLDLYGQLLEQQDDFETRRQYERWERFERAAWGRVDRVVTMSEKDRLTVGAPHAEALANGVDVERFQPSGDPTDPGRILFIGSFAHYPNVLALDFFLREAWPVLRPLGARLHIIAGSRPDYFLDMYKQRVRPPLDQPVIELEAFVSDVRPAYRRAAVVIAPLLASAGTNIKIMEAMAMGKAIVSTPAGINGLDELVDGRDVVVASTGGAMAAEIAALFTDPVRRSALEREARRTAVRCYDWDVIAERQKNLYRELL